jgi:alkanesulfonate monooxygenase
LAHKLDVLKGHCDSLGRDYGEISKTLAGFMYTGQDAAEVIEQATAMAHLGFDHVIFNVIDDYQGSPIETLGTEVLPALAEL